MLIKPNIPRATLPDKNSPFSSAGSSHSAHNEATADMRGRSCSQITADTARRHRSRSPSLDPRYRERESLIDTKPWLTLAPHSNIAQRLVRGAKRKV